MLSEDTIILFGITPGVTEFRKVYNMLKYFMKEKKEIDYNDRFNIIFFTGEGPKYFEDFTLNPAHLLETLSDSKSEIIEADIAGGIFISAMYVVEVFQKISGKCFRMIILSDSGSKKIPEKQMSFLSDLLEKITDIPFIMDAVRIDGDDPRDDLRLMKLARRTGGDLYEIDEIDQEAAEAETSAKEKEKTVIEMLGKLSRTPLNLAKKLKKEVQEEEMQEKEQFSDLQDVLNHLKGKKKVEAELFEVNNMEDIPPKKRVFYEGLGEPLQPVGGEGNKRCMICFTSLKNQELLKCPNCKNIAHKICFAIWAKKSNIGIPHIFRCPNCYSLIKMDSDLIKKVNRVKTPTIEVCKDLENVCLEEYLESLESPEGPKVITSEEGSFSEVEEETEEESKQKVETEGVSKRAETDDKELKMIWCPKCGKMITNEYNRCPQCGYKLRKVKPSEGREAASQRQEEAEILSQISELKVKEKSDLKAKNHRQAIQKAQKIRKLAKQLGKEEMVQEQENFIEKVEEERNLGEMRKDYNRKFSYLKNKVSNLLKHNAISKAYQAVEDFSVQNEDLISSLATPEYEKFKTKITDLYQGKGKQEKKKTKTGGIKQVSSQATEEDIWEKLDEKEGEIKSKIGEITKLNEARKQISQKVENHEYDGAIKILNSAIDDISSQELAEYKRSLQEKKAKIRRKKKKHNNLSKKITKEQKKYEKNHKKDNLYAALNYATNVKLLAGQLQNAELKEKYSEIEKDLVEEIEDQKEKDVVEGDELEEDLKSLEDTIKIEYFDDDLIPIIKKYHLDELEQKHANSEKIIKVASKRLKENRNKMKEKITQELIVYSSNGEVFQKQAQLGIERIEKSKKVKKDVFKKIVEYKIEYKPNFSAKRIEDLTIQLKVPYHFKLTSLFIHEQEFINLAIKQPTKGGLKYSFILEDLSLSRGFSIHYQLERHISRILLFTKKNYLYMIKCFYNVSVPSSEASSKILLPFDINDAQDFNWLIIEDIFPINYSPVILEPENLECAESSLDEKGKLVGWILENLSAGTHLFQYLLVSPEKLALLTNYLQKKLQNADAFLQHGNLIGFKKNVEELSSIIRKELKS
ncbi:MAG: hypothetical protein R6U96_07320 [Promethearchaeia archaeon]